MIIGQWILTRLQTLKIISLKKGRKQDNRFRWQPVNLPNFLCSYLNRESFFGVYKPFVLFGPFALP